MTTLATGRAQIVLTVNSRTQRSQSQAKGSAAGRERISLLMKGWIGSWAVLPHGSGGNRSSLEVPTTPVFPYISRFS